MRQTISIDQQRKRVESLPPDELRAMKTQWIAYISEPVRRYHEPRIETRLPTMFIVWAHGVLMDREEIPT